MPLPLFVRRKSLRLDEMVSFSISKHIDSFPSLNVYVFPFFVFIIDGRSDFGPGRSKGGTIYANGQ